MQPALNSRKRAPSTDFLGAPGAYFAQLFLTEIGSSAPFRWSNFDSVLVSPMSGADLFHGYGYVDFQCRQMYLHIMVSRSQIFLYHEFRQIEIPVPGASMAIDTLSIGLSQLLHDDFAAASDNIVDWRPKDFFMGTLCASTFTLQSMGHGMRLQ